MYRDDLELGTADVHNFVLSHGALGDVITSLPAIIHARRMHHKSLRMDVWCPPWQMELIDHLLKPYGEFTIKDVSKVPRKKEEREAIGGQWSINTMVGNTHTRNRVHMVDYAFNCLIDAQPESMEQRNYPTIAPVTRMTTYANAVVFPVGATSDNKLFRASVMQPVIEWVVRSGYKPVLVGTKVSHTRAELGGGGTEELVIRDEIDKLPDALVKQCFDLREFTTLIDLRTICGNAKAVVGVDGGTLHLAGTTDTNIIYALGTTLPKHRYITRLGDPSHKIRYIGPRDLACAGCQSNWTMTSFDFRYCAYGDNACMGALHPDDFIEALKQLGL